jgi:N-acetylglucosamine kinase-like BadF-type ATPase
LEGLKCEDLEIRKCGNFLKSQILEYPTTYNEQRNMILIADSGSTKTDWRLLDKNGVLATAKTVGFNPFYQTSENIVRNLEEESLRLQLKNYQPEEIYYYGTGCSTDAKRTIVETALAEVFPKATIQINHDLLGAARALCGTSEAIACILGTGSNSCHFDGKEIVSNVPNLGFLLGDEGSGGYMGKRLIQAFLNNELPEELHQKFAERYQLTRDEIMDQVYTKPFPNRYLASFTMFLSETYEHPFTHNLILKGFDDFFTRNITKYEKHKTLPVHFLGSIAFIFTTELKEIAEKHGVQIGKIIRTPIEGLIEYHS